MSRRLSIQLSTRVLRSPDGLALGTDATYEDLLEQKDKLVDVSGYKVRGEGWNLDPFDF